MANINYRGLRDRNPQYRMKEIQNLSLYPINKVLLFFPVIFLTKSRYANVD